ncbi:hypothetical protein [Bacillus velezensis]|uniref:hypothetical protein n=1 Tax=Bacillus velezensis TaxID=492670 RepID=UPI00145529FD|nr:hypothetical protein [Bacillus velezensis]
MKPFQTAFYNADHAQSSLGDVLKNDVLKQTDLIRVKDIGSYQEGKQLVESGKVSVLYMCRKALQKRQNTMKKQVSKSSRTNKAL